MSDLAGPAPDLLTSTPISKDREIPWWLFIMIGLIGWMAVLIAFSDAYQEAFREIIPGLKITLYLTIGSFAAAMPLGLFIGLSRMSKNTFVSTIATVYIEFIRGVPMIVCIFTIAFVLTPDFADIIGVRTRDIPPVWRGGAALCLFYAAFIAEVFRAGIQSVDRGQTEAAKAIGLSGRHTMRFIVLPQAIRNTLPALGNDFISLMKDTSLVTVLAVGELTQEARIYSGVSFRFRESFFILLVIYVTLTLGLSLLLRLWERYLEIPGR